MTGPLEGELVDPIEVRDGRIFEAWLDGANFDLLAREHLMDRTDVRRVVVARQLARGGPSKELVVVRGGRDVTGDLVATGARHLPQSYRGDGPPPDAPQDVIDNWLPDSAKRMILRGKSEHTIRAYLAGVGWWSKFAEANRITVLPAPQNGMIRMLDSWELLPVHVKCTGRKQADGTPCEGHRPSPSAVWIWYSGMKWIHGLGEPPFPWNGGEKLADAIVGYIKQMKDDGWRQTKAPRALQSEIRAMVDAVAGAPDTVLAESRRDMIVALVLAAYYTGGRASDIARYRIGDIERFGDHISGGIELTLARSKATKGDRNEEQRTIHRDLEHPDYCGVAAVERWVARLRHLGVTQGALFRPIHKTGSIIRGAPDGLAYRMDVTGLSRTVSLAAKLAHLYSDGKILPNWADYTIHSLRRARVQDLLEGGADVWDVEEELGWAHGGAIKHYRAQVKRQSKSAANAKGML